MILLMQFGQLYIVSTTANTRTMVTTATETCR